MRGVSLRIKINIAILLAFVVAAGGFAAILTSYMADREASTHNRTRILLAALAAHRMERLVPALDKTEELAAARDILDRLVRVEGVVEASLFDELGRLVATAGERPAPPLRGEKGEALPGGRVFTAADEDGKLSAVLVEPIASQGRRLGYLRLRYSMRELHALNQQTWLVFGLAVAGAYLLLATILNVMLHRFVLRPVDVLRQGLQALEAGRLGHAVPVASRDALGKVAMAFNAMSARLKETSESLAASRAEIEEHRRLLARRVEERTADLARANARLVAEVEARREAEARQERTLALYKAILESTAEGVLCITATPETKILAMNRRFLELWGLPESWPSLPDRQDRFQAVLDRVRDPEAVRVAFMALMRDDARLDVACLELADGRFLERRSGPIIQAGTYIGRVLSYVDVTAEKRREARTEEAKTKAEDASRAKGAFLAVMSHEIRTPLSVVIGLTEEMLASPASAEQLGHLATIRDAAAHLIGLVNDILDFSRIEAGRLVLERADFDPRDLAAGVAGTFALQARRKKLDLSVSVHDDVPRVLRGDPGRLRQVLLNLVGNAVKFTDAGSVRLTVALAPEPEAADGRVGLAVRVADTGIGIAEKDLADLFERFRQGGETVARGYGGSGLGLAISKGLVERMGGRIDVESRPGQGSVFTVTVRLLPGRDPLPEPSERPAADTAGRRLRILLVEDNELNAAVTRLHMARMGHDLTVAASAREAYDRLAAERFDAVLMDIEMPETDGIAATRTIRAGGPPGRPVLEPEVPIIAVTAHAVEDVRQQCLEAGMAGFVTKPVHYRTLQRILEAMDRPVQSQFAAAALPPPVPAAATGAAGPGAALFDPDAAREGMGISWSQYESLSRVSHDEGGRRLAEAAACLEAGDRDGAAIAAHTVKGAAATLGAYSSREAAGDLERAVRQGDGDAAREALARLEALWREVSRVFADWRPPV